MADLDLAPDVNDGPETSDAIASLAAKLQQLLILFNHIGNIRITAKLSPPDWVELIRATACQTNIFVKISALVESAPRDSKKAPGNLVLYKKYINMSGMISEMNRLFTAAIGRSVNSPLMMKRYNEFSCNTHKKKGDDTLGNSARSMPNWHTSGVSEKGDTKAVLA